MVVVMTITDFLLARIAEDEHRAKQSWAGGHRGSRWLSEPDRQLAECKAKRAIVDLYAAHLDRAMAYRSPRWADAMSETDKAKAKRQEARLGVSEVAIRYLAAVYASHPDYDPEWADMTYR